MDREDLYYPECHFDTYTIIEFHMMTGRTIETKKKSV